MTPTMRALARRISRPVTAVVALLSQLALPWRVEWALGAPGGALRAAPMSPLLVGLIAGALALGVGAIVLVIVKLLARKAPPSG